jgi:hypothetical protein
MAAIAAFGVAIVSLFAGAIVAFVLLQFEGVDCSVVWLFEHGWPEQSSIRLSSFCQFSFVGGAFLGLISGLVLEWPTRSKREEFQRRMRERKSEEDRLSQWRIQFASCPYCGKEGGGHEPTCEKW